MPTSSILSARWTPLLVFAAAYALSFLYAQPPGMGDDIDYYGFAIARHFPTPAIAPDEGFHFLRWPVWGGIWLYQAVLGPGLGSFLFVPRFCIAMGCALVFIMGRRIAAPVAGLIAAVLLFFHPLVDGLLARPMPDVTEGLLGTLGFFLFWSRLRRSEEGRRPGWVATLLTGLAVGVLVYVTWANRPTGLIWVIGMLLLSLTRLRVMWPVIALAIPVAAACYGVEGLIYKRLFGDFFHSVTANLSATGRQGTEAMAVWALPFRFLDTLMDAFLSKLVALLGIAGAWFLWRRRRQMSDLWVIGWCVLAYLGIACAVQSVFPFRPLVRDGARFLGSVAFPFSLLAGVGLHWLATEAAQRWPSARRWTSSWRGAVALLAVLLIFSERELRDLAYLPTVARWMEETPDGTRVMTHDDFYSVAMAADPAKAQKLDWVLFSRVKLPTRAGVLSPETNGNPQWLFIHRPRVMVSARKRFEAKREIDLEDLKGNMRALDEKWRIADVALREEKPEFYRFAVASGPVAPVSLLPLVRGWDWKPEPLSWWRRVRGKKPSDDRVVAVGPSAVGLERRGRGHVRLAKRDVEIPEALRGKTFNVRFKVSTKTIKPFAVLVQFFDAKGGQIGTEIMEPYGTLRGLYDFQGIHVPAEAARADLQLQIEPNSKGFTLESLDVYLPAASEET